MDVRIRCTRCKTCFKPENMQANRRLCSKCLEKRESGIREDKLREDCDIAWQEGARL